MSAQKWIDVALSGKPVWDIGQIDKPTARALDRLVKRGELTISRLSFCNISRPKKVWHLPSVRP